MLISNSCAAVLIKAPTTRADVWTSDLLRPPCELPKPSTAPKTSSLQELGRISDPGEAPDLVVLDELGLALDYGLLDANAVISTLQTRPGRMDVILTGPAVPEPVMAMADQVTELRRDRC